MVALVSADLLNHQTPLNNNMRELFNLMNFLDSVEWKDLELLDRQYQELDEELVKQLHTRLRPYFLRRLKSEVLNLPPKVRFSSRLSCQLFQRLPRTKSSCLSAWLLSRRRSIDPF